jgi:DNA-directed RNA polymerase specialized sigma24 family protein
MDEAALRRLLDSALVTRGFPERPVPVPVPQAGIMLAARARHPPRAGAAVVLRYWADLSVEQVADVLGCAAGNVNCHDAYALAKLQAVLGEPLADPGPASGPG